MIGIRCYEMLGLDVSLDTDFMQLLSLPFPRIPGCSRFMIASCIFFFGFFLTTWFCGVKGLTRVRVFCHIALLFWNELCIQRLRS